MQKITSYILTILFFSSILSFSQHNSSSMIYIHPEKPSFKSQFFQKAASLFGVKKYIEKSIQKEKYDQNVAPIPKTLLKNANINSSIKKGRQIWKVSPKANASNKVILYLHGGAYYWNISKYNWSFTEELLLQTNATIIIPDYPIAPQATCVQTYNFIYELYTELLLQHDPKNIILMGESAGGGLTLGFAMFLREKNEPQPHQLILLAPWLDVTMTNPEILNIDKNDKILGIEGLQMAGKGYAGQLSTTDYKVSPIYGSLSHLAKISVFVGTHDLFLADARKLKDKAHAQNIHLRYYEYPKMFHVWILVKKLKEAEKAKQQIIALIRE